MYLCLYNSLPTYLLDWSNVRIYLLIYYMIASFDILVSVMCYPYSLPALCLCAPIPRTNRAIVIPRALS